MKRNNYFRKPQEETKKDDKKSGKPTSVTNINSRNVGAIAELELFDYNVGRIDAAKFQRSQKNLSDYLGSKFGRNAHIIEHFDEEYQFQEPNRPVYGADDSDEEKGYIRKAFEKRLEHYIKRSEEYNDNKPKVYAIIWGQCSTSMRHKVMENAYFEEFSEEKDPRLLWRTICEISMSGRGVRNVAKNMQDAKDRFSRVHQFSNESVGDFYERFLSEIDALEFAECDPGTQEELAISFLNKLDRKKFRKMLDDLENSAYCGQDLYPTSILTAYQMALNRKDNFDNQGNGNNAQNQIEKGAAFNAKGKKNGNRSNYNNVRNDSHGSHKKEYKSDDGQPDKNTTEENYKKKGPKCYFCGEFGHYKNNCEWLIKAAKELEKNATKESKAVISIGDEANKQSEDDDYGISFCLETKVSTVVVASIGDFDVLCDNESSVNVFKEARLLTNIRKTDHTMHITGIGGTIKTNMVGDFPFFGEVYYHPRSIANILSFYDLVKTCDVNFNSKRNSFKIENKEGNIMEFKPQGKLYQCNAKHLIDNYKGIALVETVAENEAIYTQREIEEAKQAIELKRRLGNPSVKDLAKMINAGSILNCPVTPTHIHRAVKIYGPDLESLKGKTVRKTPKTVHFDSVFKNVVSEVTLCIDIFYISGVAFLLSVSRRLGLLMVRHIPNKNVLTLQQAIDSFISSYQLRSFRVTTVLFDGEGDAKVLKNHLESKGIAVNTTAKNEHVPEIERAGRQLKERVRGRWNTLPYKVTMVLIIYLVYFCVQTINLFPKAGGLSSNSSPKELFTGRKLDYSIECKLAFGDYVQVHEENSPSNTMKERTIGAIALGSSGNLQGSYDFLSLSTWKVIKRRSFTQLPVPSIVIEVINAKAEEELKVRKTVNIAEAIYRLGYRDIASDMERDEDIMDVIPLEQSREEYANELQQTIVPPNINASNSEIGNNNFLNDNDNIDIVSDNSYNINEDNASYSSNISNNDDLAVEDSQDHRSDDDIIVTNNITNNVLTNNNNNHEQYNINNNNALVEYNNNNINQIISQVEELGTEENTRRSLRDRTKLTNWKNKYSSITLTQMSMKKGISSKGLDAIIAIMSEMQQMVQKKVFHGLNKSMLTAKQLDNIVRCHLFLKVKRDGRIKGRLVVDGRMQNRALYSNSDTSSPTVATESIFITAAIEASEKRHVITIDIEGAYLHAPMTNEVIMVIDPILATILVQVDPTYEKYINNNNNIYVKLDKALYGCVESALLFYNHISTSLLTLGYNKNAYDMCVFNKIVDGNQCTITIHVDDLKASCAHKNVLDDLVKELTKIYKKVNVHDGNIIDYLGMEFDYSDEGTVKVSMKAMIDEVIADMTVSDTAPTPAAVYLFKVSEDSKLLNNKDRETYHSVVAKLLYIAKRGRPDILTAVAFLSTRVKQPLDEDMNKLRRVLNYLNGSRDLYLYLSSIIQHDTIAGNIIKVNAYIDASFATHLDGKGHTGTTIDIGAGAVFNKSSKQKLVSKSSTEAELVAVSDGLSQVLWTKNFLEEQGYKVSAATIYQDNKSTITLIEKGRSNSGRTRHVNVRYFLVKDYVDRKEVRMEYLFTGEMNADFYTKPLQGELFKKMRAKIMNLPEMRRNSNGKQ